MKRQGVLLLCALFGAGALSGCESRPRPPLYSSAQATGSFGYFEEQLGKDRLRVGYRAPLRRDSTTSQGERRREADRLVNLSYDLALLRAAELAQVQGAPSFDVSERENDVEVAVYTHYAPDPFYPPWPYWHPRYSYWPHHYGGYYGPMHYGGRSSEVAVSVTFVVTLKPDGGGAFDTADTLASLRSKHGVSGITPPQQDAAPHIEWKNPEPATAEPE